MILFVGVFTALAVGLLAAYPDLSAFGLGSAVLWLLFVGLRLRFAVTDAGGVRRFAVEQIGTFSERQFVEVRTAGDRTLIGFGYELSRRRFYYLRLEPEQLISVEMSSGAATALAGADRDDWHVAVWYRDPGPDADGLRDRVHIVGPSGARAATETFFRAFVALVHAAVELHPTGKENEFRAAGADGAPLTPPSPPSPAA